MDLENSAFINPNLAAFQNHQDLVVLETKRCTRLYGAFFFISKTTKLWWFWKKVCIVRACLMVVLENPNRWRFALHSAPGL